MAMNKRLVMNSLCAEDLSVNVCSLALFPLKSSIQEQKDIYMINEASRPIYTRLSMRLHCEEDCKMKVYNVNLDPTSGYTRI